MFLTTEASADEIHNIRLHLWPDETTTNKFEGFRYPLVPAIKARMIFSYYFFPSFLEATELARNKMQMSRPSPIKDILTIVIPTLFMAAFKLYTA